MSFLDFIGKLSTTLSFSITFGTVILYGALGEVLTEKGGNLNLGVPGIMYIGAIASLAGALKFEAAFASPNAILCILVALLCGFAASALAGLLYAFLTISLRTNQNVTGLTLTIFGTGIGNYIGGSLGSVGTVCATNTSAAMKDYIRPLAQWLDGLTDKLNIGSLLFRHGFMVYFGILLAIALWYFLTKTRTGLSLRAVGENAATADAPVSPASAARSTSWNTSMASGRPAPPSRRSAGWPSRWSSSQRGSRCAASGARTCSASSPGCIS